MDLDKEELIATKNKKFWENAQKNLYAPSSTHHIIDTPVLHLSTKNNCWLCKNLKENSYKEENLHKTLKLNIYKSHNNKYYIQAVREDIIEQEIVYCPICGRKLV